MRQGQGVQGELGWGDGQQDGALRQEDNGEQGVTGAQQFALELFDGDGSRLQQFQVTRVVAPEGVFNALEVGGQRVNSLAEVGFLAFEVGGGEGKQGAFFAQGLELIQ